MRRVSSRHQRAPVRLSATRKQHGDGESASPPASDMSTEQPLLLWLWLLHAD